MARYRFLHSSQISGGGSQPIRIGYPIPEHIANDVCLCCNGSYEFIPLNRFIVREALLSDPEGVAALFGIKVIDLANNAAAKQEDAAKKEEQPAKKHPQQKQKPSHKIEDLGEITKKEVGIDG